MSTRTAVLISSTAVTATVAALVVRRTGLVARLGRATTVRTIRPGDAR